MLHFIHKQTKQYEAYTDRYLEFKVEMRKEMPYKKTLYNNAFDPINAIVAFQKFAEACTIFSTAVFKSGELKHKTYL